MLTILLLQFTGDIDVMFGLATCDITSSTYEEIVCVTSASSETNNTVTLTVTNSYNALLPVGCVTEDCWFMFTADATPTLTALHSPDKVNNHFISNLIAD